MICAHLTSIADFKRQIVHTQLYYQGTVPALVQISAQDGNQLSRSQRENHNILQRP